MPDVETAIKIAAASCRDVRWIKKNMDEYDRRFLPEENIREINFIVRNASNEKIAGVLSNTRYATVYINTVWVHEKYRNKGIGRRLIGMVEEKAKGMGCVLSALGTWESFHAREFYEKLGYKVISISRNSPEGQTGYWFNKDL